MTMSLLRTTVADVSREGLSGSLDVLEAIVHHTDCVCRGGFYCGIAGQPQVVGRDLDQGLGRQLSSQRNSSTAPQQAKLKKHRSLPCIRSCLRI